MKYTVNDWLREKRKEKGLTQIEIANVLGVSQSVVNRWENGKIEIPNQFLAKLTDIFGVSKEEPFLILSKQFSFDWKGRDIIVNDIISDKINKITNKMLDELYDFKVMVYDEFVKNIRCYFAMTNKLCKMFNIENRMFVMKGLCNYLKGSEHYFYDSIVNEHTIYAAALQFLFEKKYDEGFYWNNKVNIKNVDKNNYINIEDCKDIDCLSFLFDEIIDLGDLNPLEEKVENYLNLKLAADDIKIIIFCLWNFHCNKFKDFKDINDFLDMLLNVNNSFILFLDNYNFNYLFDSVEKDILNSKYFNYFNIMKDDLDIAKKNFSNINKNLSRIIALYQLAKLRTVCESNQILNGVL